MITTALARRPLPLGIAKLFRRFGSWGDILVARSCRATAIKADKFYERGKKKRAISLYKKVAVLSHWTIDGPVEHSRQRLESLNIPCEMSEKRYNEKTLAAIEARRTG